MQTAKLIIFGGHVQGIGFRYTAHRIAVRYNLAGCVRNTSDGKVEMHAQGHPDDIDDCINDIKDTFAGYIRNVDIKDVSFCSDYDSFIIQV